jgi:hypothetical protein
MVGKRFFSLMTPVKVGGSADELILLPQVARRRSYVFYVAIKLKLQDPNFGKLFWKISIQVNLVTGPERAQRLGIRLKQLGAMIQDEPHPGQ